MKIILALTAAFFCLNVALAEMRIWTSTDGQTVEAEFFTTIGDQVALKGANGKQLKLPLKSLSAADLEYIDIAQPPKLNITFTKQTKQRRRKASPFISNEVEIRIMDYTFGVKINQTSARTYNQVLTVEYFAIGDELRGDKNILLARNSDTFTLTEENDQSFQLKSDKTVEILDYSMKSRRFGKKFVGNLVTVTDVRGEVIAFNSNPTWLITNIENLKQLPVGAYFDKTCTRCYPTPPKSWY